MAMTNLVTRTLYGLLFAVIMVGSIIYDSGLFAFIMFVFCLIGVSEMAKLHPKYKFRIFDKLLFSISSLLVYIPLTFVALEFSESKILLLAIIGILLPFIHGLFSKKIPFSELALVHWSSILFVAFPAGLMFFFFNEKVTGFMAGPYLLLAVIVFIWLNDIFAYLVGSQFGKRRLFARISPKKSWEGSIGGLIFTLLSAYLLSVFIEWISLKDALIIASIIVIFGSLGDLIESMMKREANVKDSGKILPGHGGVLDRFDATFFAVPFVFIYLILIQ